MLKMVAGREPGNQSDQLWNLLPMKRQEGTGKCLIYISKKRTVRPKLLLFVYRIRESMWSNKRMQLHGPSIKSFKHNTAGDRTFTASFIVMCPFMIYSIGTTNVS